MRKTIIFAALILSASALNSRPALTQEPMVDCTIGAWDAAAPRVICDFVIHAAQLLRYPAPKYQNGLLECGKSLSDSLGVPKMIKSGNPLDQGDGYQLQALSGQLCGEILTANAQYGNRLPIQMNR